MRYWKRVFVLGVLDSVLIFMAILTLYALRFDFQWNTSYTHIIPYVVLAHILCNVTMFIFFGIYRRLWQFASIGEAFAIFQAVVFAEVLFIAVDQIVHLFFSQLIVPNSFYLSFVFIFLMTGGARFIYRFVKKRTMLKGKTANARRALIVGAGQAGVLVITELLKSDDNVMPVAFIDDDSKKQSLQVKGLPVVGDRYAIPKVVQKYRIDDVIIAIPSAPRKVIHDIITICHQTKASVKILPKMSDLINGKVTVNEVRDVSIEDLLGRDPVNVNLAEISEYIHGQSILVTGAGGSIGSELCRQIARFHPQQLLLLGRGENSLYDIEQELIQNWPQLAVEPIIADIQDEVRMKQLFGYYRPSIVFHAAAHKHVPLMEKNPEEAIKNNVLGTLNVAKCAHEFRTERFVMISTDKAVNPTSVMGASKRVAEMIVQGMNRKSPTRFSVVRFGNVLGSRGSVIPLFKRQIACGGPVTVTHPDMVRYFMTIPEAAQLVIQAGAFAEGGEIFILDMGEPVKIVDLAKDMIRLSGLELDKDISIVYTGIRPGEKLFEELMTDEERLSITKHDRIYLGQSSGVMWSEFQQAIQQLEQLVKKSSTPPEPLEIKRLIRQIVPSYQGIRESELKDERTVLSL